MAYEKQNFLDGQIITADHLNHIEDGIIDLLMVYPVGSIYISVNSTSPASLFGGTWERIEDRFLLAAGSTYGAGSTGGEAEHTMTVNEMPSHRHTSRVQWSKGGSDMTNALAVNVNSSYVPVVAVTESDVSGFLSVDNGDQENIGEFGGGAAHNNMPPYLAVYMWKRVA